MGRSQVLEHCTSQLDVTKTSSSVHIINCKQCIVHIMIHQSMTNIFEYSNIRIYWSKIFIWTFIRIKVSFLNILGHSFVSNLFVQIYSDIHS